MSPDEHVGPTHRRVFRASVLTIILSAGAAVAAGIAVLHPTAGYIGAILGFAAAYAAWRDLRTREPRNLTPQKRLQLAEHLRSIQLKAPVHVFSVPGSAEPRVLRDALASAFEKSGTQVIVGEALLAKNREGISIYHRPDLAVEAAAVQRALAAADVSVQQLTVMQPEVSHPDFFADQYRLVIGVGSR